MPKTKPDPNSLAVLAGRLGGQTRHHPDQDHTELELAVKAVALEEYVRKVIHEAPPLTPAQIDRIAAVLREQTP